MRLHGHGVEDGHFVDGLAVRHAGLDLAIRISPLGQACEPQPQASQPPNHSSHAGGQSASPPHKDTAVSTRQRE